MASYQFIIDIGTKAGEALKYFLHELLQKFSKVFGIFLSRLANFIFSITHFKFDLNLCFIF
jgi:hypothetical protein